MAARQSPASFDPEDAHREARRQAELKQKRIQLVDDLHSLKTHYYEEYMDGLAAKIKKQRKDIKRKTEEFNKRLELEQMGKHEACRYLKKKSSRSSLHHDNSFLENLEKNRMHQICVIESKLLKEGRFKTVEDRDRFWEGLAPDHDPGPLTLGASHIRDAHNCEEQRAPSESSKDSNTLHHGEDNGTAEKPPAALLGLIREDTEISSAASNRRGRGSVPLQKQKSTVSSNVSGKHPKVEAFKEKFKQVEFPSLSAFTLDLEPEREDAVHLNLRQRYDHRARLRRQNSKQLNRMYQMSLVHLAATQRMLDSNDLVAALKDPSLSDVVLASDFVGQLRLSPTDGDGGMSMRDNTSPVEADMNITMGERSAAMTPSQPSGFDLSPQTDQDTGISDGGTIDDGGISSISHLPLSLDAVVEKSSVIQAKPPGVFWYNYGKFLPSIVT